MGRLAVRMVRRFLDRTATSYSMEDALARAASRHMVRTVVDVGASDGRWTLAARRHFTPERWLLIEAQRSAHEAALRRLQERHPEMDCVLAAAGDREGTIHFDASDPLGGVAREAPFAENDVSTPMTTVDVEVARRGLAGPFLVKLDTHGFEVPILEGAKRTLEQTAVLIVEVYNFKLSPTCLRFHELCAWLEGRGFRVVDACDILHRPGDGALWQMDLVFARAGAPIFDRASYR
jgi:FkbM family methyltransferase